MKEEDKNRKPDLSDFIRYQKRDMTYLQRNTFEKKLQKDPFASEAGEGFSKISPEQVNNDLVYLEKKLKIRSSHNRRVLIYRIAASIAVLIAISSVYFLAERNKLKFDRNEIALNQTTLEITKSKAITLPEIIPYAETIQTTQEKKVKQRNAVENEIPSVVLPQPDEIVSSTGKEPENIASLQVEKDDIYQAPDSEKSEEKELPAAAGTRVQEQIDLAERTLDETIITGYAASKRSKSASGLEVEEGGFGNEIPGYTPSSPVDGFKSFDKYIEENMRKPASFNEGEKAVVILSFTLKSSGVIENFKIIKSQGQEYSDEAVRLIKEGPLWKPAEENGNKIDEEVRLSIVFR